MSMPKPRLPYTICKRIVPDDGAVTVHLLENEEEVSSLDPLCIGSMVARDLTSFEKELFSCLPTISRSSNLAE